VNGHGCSNEGEEGGRERGMEGGGGILREIIFLQACEFVDDDSYGGREGRGDRS
jgi:hypothetical protein